METYDIVKAIFLLLLAISGNFLAETLGCQTQNLLRNNQFVKQILIFFVIYFTLGLSSKKPVNPMKELKFAFTIWILYIMFTKTNIYFSISIFILFSINVIVQNYIDYYQSLGDNKKQLVKMLTKIHKTINTIIIILLLIGFVDYFLKQYKEYKNDWSSLKFIFGKTECASN